MERKKKQLQRIENKVEELFVMVKAYIDYKELLSNGYPNFRRYTGHGVADTLKREQTLKEGEMDHVAEIKENILDNGFADNDDALYLISEIERSRAGLTFYAQGLCENDEGIELGEYGFIARRILGENYHYSFSDVQQALKEK